MSTRDGATMVIAACAAFNPDAPPPRRPGARRRPVVSTVPVCDVPRGLESARRAMAWARTGGASSTVSDARAALAALAAVSGFLAAGAAVASDEHVLEAMAIAREAEEILRRADSAEEILRRADSAEARAMASIASELLEIHASAAVRGV